MRKMIDWIHYFFVPSERNNLKARSIHNDFLTAYLAIALFMVFSFKTFHTQLTNVLGFATDISTQRLYELTNEERQKNNLPPLTYNETLAKAAYLKAQDMFGDDYWAHYSPTGKSPWDFVLKSGYKYQYAGENLAKNFLFSKDVVSAWMDSSTHKENIVRKEFNDVGFAIVNGVLNGEETTLVVQMFGTAETRGEPLAVQAEEPQNLIPTQTINNGRNAQRATNEQEKIVSSPRRNLAGFSFNLSYVFFAFILFVLIVDLYFAHKMQIVRISSRNLAHIVFLIFIFAGFILYVTKGAIV